MGTRNLGPGDIFTNKEVTNVIKRNVLSNMGGKCCSRDLAL